MTRTSSGCSTQFAPNGCWTTSSGSCAARAPTPARSTPAASPRCAICASSRATRRSRSATRCSSSICGASKPGPRRSSRCPTRWRAAGFTHLAPMLGRWCGSRNDSTVATRARAAIPAQQHRGMGARTHVAARPLRERRGVGAADPVERRAMVDEQDAAFLAESRRLGKVIAEMHLALAAGGARHRQNRRR